MRLRDSAKSTSWRGFSVSILTLVVTLLLTSTAAEAQEADVRGGGPFADFISPEGEPPKVGSDSTATESAEQDEKSGPRSQTLPSIWCGDIDEAETKQVCWDAYRAGLAYYQTGLEHRSEVFAWQHFSTKVIFVVVLLLVAAGIFFAWLQFQRGDVDKQSELEIGMQGVKINSPVIGLIILTLSLAFFYLYLVHVYPINELI